MTHYLSLAAAAVGRPEDDDPAAPASRESSAAVSASSRSECIAGAIAFPQIVEGAAPRRAAVIFAATNGRALTSPIGSESSPEKKS